MKKILLLVIVGFALLYSCNNSSDIVVSNLKIDIDSVVYLDYQQAYINGFRVPNNEKEEIDFSFKIRGDRTKKMYYKIFYQNESYKFDEKSSDEKLLSENFYGSFHDVWTEFVEIKKRGKIRGSFVIEGNPRCEQRYFGFYREKTIDTVEVLNYLVKDIKNDKNWFEIIKTKAKKDNISIEEQLEKDALWLINSKSITVNNRWKRNIRVGKYSFLLVLTTEEDLKKIPYSIKNIGTKNGEYYQNPYQYFLYGKGHRLKNTKVIKIEDLTRLVAKPPVKNGIYVEYNKKSTEDTLHFEDKIGNRESLYNRAAFEYYRNMRLHDQVVSNIPVLADFYDKGYTKEDYEKNIKQYDNKRIDILFTNSKSPGATFGLDSLQRGIYFFNPASTKENMRKENVGIKTRNGFCYGKYTVKVKMAPLLTKGDVWTGLTNAIWMITESLEPWNNRRHCWAKGRGYKPYYGAGKDEQTVEETAYSEIDFEMIKSAQHWPKTSYSDNKEREESLSNSDKVMIACTNWDMSCWEPEDYGVGVRKIKYGDYTFDIHRWDHWYSALTSKVPKKDVELFGGDYYYYQIEWKPNEIIWRVGSELDKLDVVGYMNDRVTNIPNNQMLVVLTQEYHQSSWWPNAPFKQENIPFPTKQLDGLLYEITIE
jgi:hypothetical protein